MPCYYCNSTNPPNPDGSCPDCGRIPPTEEQLYPMLSWRCTTLYLLYSLIKAALIAALLVGIVWGIGHFDLLNDSLKELFNKYKNYFWIVAAAIPCVYFLFSFFVFAYKWLSKKYELRPKDIRLLKGIFSLTTNSTLLETLWGIKLRQNVFQRLIGTGKITLYSDDATTPALQINDIGQIRTRFNELVRYQEYALDCSNVKVEKDVNIDSTTKVWRYSKRDLIDELICGVLITVALILVGWFFPWGNAFVRYALLLIIPAIYWLYLLWTFIDKICCTTYTLNNATLVKESGIFSKKIDVYVLCHIKDCEMSQNLWQRIIGDVGNLTLILRCENKDREKDKSPSSFKKEVLHGLSDHTNKFELFKERWVRERHRRQA